MAPLEMTVQRMLKVDEVCLFSGLSEVGTEDLVIAVETDRELPKAELDQVAREFPSFGKDLFCFVQGISAHNGGNEKNPSFCVEKACIFASMRGALDRAGK